ncbi:structural protein [Pseudoalteromonas phage J2-1_QLiu-2017]|nr:structural protein [Pseudoalteromonas phage J2-1_QLiu-2017]
MAKQVALAQIAIEQATITGQGFSVPIFIANTQLFKERVRVYTDLTEVVADGFTEDTPTYKALSKAFGQEPRPSQIKVGRVESDIIYVPQDVADGKEFKMTFNALDAADALEVSYTAVGGDTAETVIDQIMAQVGAEADIAAKVNVSKLGVGADAILSVENTNAGEWITVTDLVNVAATSYSATETASVAMAAIQEYDNDFYYIVSQNKAQAWLESLAGFVETQFKFFRVTVKEAGAYSNPMTGTCAAIKAKGYDRTKLGYHHLAEEDYPELAAIAELSTYTTGSVDFALRQVDGIGVSLNAQGNKLSATERKNLDDGQIEYFDVLKTSGAGVSQQAVVIGSRMSSGEDALNIVARDNLVLDLEVAYTNFLAGRKASRVTWSDRDLTAIKGLCSGILKKYADEDIHNFIEPDFRVTVPRSKDISAADKATKQFKHLSFRANLRGGINTITVYGTLALV